MNKPNSQVIKVTLPSGYSAEVTVPAIYEAEIIEVGLRAFLGTLVGLTESPDRAARRSYLARYIASIINIAEMTLKRMVVAKSLESANISHIVENFLESLKREAKGGTSE